jgi:hypothetical protein
MDGAAVTIFLRAVGQEGPGQTAYIQDVYTARQLHERAFAAFDQRPLRLIHCGAVVPATQVPIQSVVPAGSATVVHVVFVPLARASYPDAEAAAAANQ